MQHSLSDIHLTFRLIEPILLEISMPWILFTADRSCIATDKLMSAAHNLFVTPLFRHILRI